MESRLGYLSTGRSVSLFGETYGAPDALQKFIASSTRRDPVESLSPREAVEAFPLLNR